MTVAAYKAFSILERIEWAATNSLFPQNYLPTAPRSKTGLKTPPVARFCPPHHSPLHTASPRRANRILHSPPADLRLTAHRCKIAETHS